jgi:hypothetical protein
LDEVYESLLHKHSILDASRLMPLIREHEELMVLSMLDQGVDEPCGVAEVDILVDEAVAYQETTYRE